MCRPLFSSLAISGNKITRHATRPGGIESIERSRYLVEIARNYGYGPIAPEDGSTIEAIFKHFVAEACRAETANDPFWQKLLDLQRDEITTVEQMFKRWRQLAGLEN